MISPQNAVTTEHESPILISGTKLYKKTEASLCKLFQNDTRVCPAYLLALKIFWKIKILTPRGEKPKLSKYNCFCAHRLNRTMAIFGDVLKHKILFSETFAPDNVDGVYFRAKPPCNWDV